MLYLYKANMRDLSTLKAENWLNNENIPYQVIFPNMLNKKLIYCMLQVADKGFNSILVSKKRSKKWREFKNIDINSMSVVQMIELIIKETQLLRTPILFDEKALLAGFNADEIRVFIPRVRREMK